MDEIYSALPVAGQIGNCLNCTLETERECEMFKNKHQNLVLGNNQLQALQMKVRCPNRPIAEQERNSVVEFRDGLKQYLATIVQERIGLINKFLKTISLLELLLHRVVVTELETWKRNQQLVQNGAKFPLDLSEMQLWCQDLFTIIGRNMEQTRIMASLRFGQHYGNEPEAIFATLSGLRSYLVSKLLVVEVQPPQAIQMGVQFATTARLLVNDGQISPQTLELSLMEISNGQSKRSIPILNNTEAFKLHPGEPYAMKAEIKKAVLESAGRKKKRSDLAVAETKYSIEFKVELNIGGESFQVSQFSLPVIVVSHGNQKPQGWATIFWDNAFSRPQRTLFDVPEEVPWPDLAEALSCKFELETGRGLTEENLQFLAETLFRVPAGTDASQRYVTWWMFSKDNLDSLNGIENKENNFWIWFYYIMDLTKSCFKTEWKSGSVLGFVGKSRARELLLNSGLVGTFLIRFSSSVLGAVVIVWLAENSKLRMMEPLTIKHLSTIRTLAGVVADLRELSYLCDRDCLVKAKEEAFDLSPSNLDPKKPDGKKKTDDGYYKFIVQVVVDGRKLHEEASLQDYELCSPTTSYSGLLTSSSYTAITPTSSCEPSPLQASTSVQSPLAPPSPEPHTFVSSSSPKTPHSELIQSGQSPGNSQDVISSPGAAAFVPPGTLVNETQRPQRSSNTMDLALAMGSCTVHGPRPLVGCPLCSLALNNQLQAAFGMDFRPEDNLSALIDDLQLDQFTDEDEDIDMPYILQAIMDNDLDDIQPFNFLPNDQR